MNKEKIQEKKQKLQEEFKKVEEKKRQATAIVDDLTQQLIRLQGAYAQLEELEREFDAEGVEKSD